MFTPLEYFKTEDHRTVTSQCRITAGQDNITVVVLHIMALWYLKVQIWCSSIHFFSSEVHFFFSWWFLWMSWYRFFCAVIPQVHSRDRCWGRWRLCTRLAFHDALQPLLATDSLAGLVTVHWWIWWSYSPSGELGLLKGWNMCWGISWTRLTRQSLKYPKQSLSSVLSGLAASAPTVSTRPGPGPFWAWPAAGRGGRHRRSCRFGHSGLHRDRDDAAVTLGRRPLVS